MKVITAHVGCEDVVKMIGGTNGLCSCLEIDQWLSVVTSEAKFFSKWVVFTSLRPDPTRPDRNADQILISLEL